MKKKHSIAHFTTREQLALHTIKNAVIEHIHPALIFYIDSSFNTTYRRSSFLNAQKEESWTFTLQLLVIHENDYTDHTVTDEEINQSLDKKYTVHTLNYTLENMAAHIEANSLFFCWMHTKGILLFQKGNTGDTFLSLPGISKRRYGNQAENLYKKHKDLRKCIDTRLNPSPFHTSTNDNLIQKIDKKHELHIEHSGILVITTDKINIL